jgi:hypothetical protein
VVGVVGLLGLLVLQLLWQLFAPAPEQPLWHWESPDP